MFNSLIFNSLIFIIALLQLVILYLLIELVNRDKPARVPVQKKPKVAEVIQCNFCKVQLPWNARRTKEGYWACDHCRITKLNQLSTG